MTKFPINQQLSFPKEELRNIKSWSFGGCRLKKRRKVARPLQAHKMIHVVFKSCFGSGPYGLLANNTKVRKLLIERSRKCFITIHDFVNMGNHIHLKISGKSVDQIRRFLRTFPALLARQITGSHRGKSFGRFWKDLVFTRVLFSSFENLQLRGYFQANRHEKSKGPIAREAYLRNFNDFLKSLKKTKAIPKEMAQLNLSLE